MRPDYSIKIDNCDGQPRPGHLVNAKGDLITQTITIDRIMLQNLDRSLRGSWVSTGSISGIKIGIISPPDLSVEDQTHIISYLSQCKRAIFTALTTLTDQDDFNALHKKLNRIIKKAEQKIHNTLIPHHNIAKLSIAKSIVRLSQISALRIHGPSFIYQDADTEITIRCDKMLEMSDLLDEKPQDSTVHEAKIGIKYAPIAGQGDFTLCLDGQVIRHEIADDNFLQEWSAGEKSIRCHDILHVKFILHQHPDPKYDLYQITEVINVIHAKAMIQDGFDYG